MGAPTISMGGEEAVEQLRPQNLVQQAQVIGQALALMTTTNVVGGRWNWALVLEPIASDGRPLAVGVITEIVDSSKVTSLLQSGLLRVSETNQGKPS